MSADNQGIRFYCNHCDYRGGEWFEPRRSAVITATYDYTDEHGKLLYQAVRFHPKDFRQRRPDGRGGWHWNMSGVRRVLYCLPELMAAKTNGTKIIWIVEGEKDAETLFEHGTTATCNAGGAGKWRDEYSESLRGFEYVGIIADKNAAGRAHAETVAGSLLGIVPHIRVIEVPDDGKDVSLQPPRHIFDSTKTRRARIVSTWSAVPQTADIDDVDEEFASVPTGDLRRHG